MSSSRGRILAESLPPRLARAYRLTRYSAAGFEIRIGRRAPAALFALLGARQATLVTAWNPGSRRMPEGWNRRMQQRLRERLRRLRVVEAEGALGGWREEMLLVGGDPRRVMQALGCFGQRAVVTLRFDCGALLCLLGGGEAAGGPPGLSPTPQSMSVLGLPKSGSDLRRPAGQSHCHQSRKRRRSC